jgi:hypothetical protein
MKGWGRVSVVVALLVSLLLLTGCFFNVFETARSVGQGKASLAVALAAMNIQIESTPTWLLTPQARLAVGLTDNLELGLRSGVSVGLATGNVAFLGAVGDLKVTLFQAPDSFALALGFGGGYSSGMVGWGLEGSVYFESTVPFFPAYFVYRPLLPLGGSSTSVIHQFAAGLHLALSPNAQLLIEVATWGGLVSGGVGIVVSF